MHGQTAYERLSTRVSHDKLDHVSTTFQAMYTYSLPGTYTITAKAIHGPFDDPEKIKTSKTLQVVVLEIPKPVVNVIQPVDGTAP